MKAKETGRQQKPTFSCLLFLSSLHSVSFAFPDIHKLKGIRFRFLTHSFHSRLISHSWINKQQGIGSSLDNCPICVSLTRGLKHANTPTHRSVQDRKAFRLALTTTGNLFILSFFRTKRESWENLFYLAFPASQLETPDVTPALDGNSILVFQRIYHVQP